MNNIKKILLLLLLIVFYFQFAECQELRGLSENALIKKYLSEGKSIKLKSTEGDGGSQFLFDDFSKSYNEEEYFPDPLKWTVTVTDFPDETETRNNY